MLQFSFNGSQLIDQVTGSSLTNSGVQIKRTERGLAGHFDGQNVGLELPSKITISKNNGAMIIAFKHKSNPPLSYATNNYLLTRSLSAQYQSNMYVNGSDRIVIESTVNGDFWGTIPGIEKNKIYLLVVNANNGTIDLFLNSTLSSSATPQSDLEIEYIGSNDGSASVYSDCEILYCKIYDEYLLPDEISNAYKDFKNPIILSETHYYPGIEYTRKPTSLNEDGLVFAYTFKDGSTLDMSGNGNDAVNNGATPVLNGLNSRGNGYDASLTLPNTIKLIVWSLSLRIDKYSAGSFDFVIGGDTVQNILFNIGGGVAFRDNDSTYYVWDGTGNTQSVPTSSIEENKQNISFVSDGTNIYLYVNGDYKGYITPNLTEISISKIIEGYTSNVYSPKLQLNDIRLYDRAISEQEAKNYHNKFAELPTYVNRMKYEKADGITTEPPVDTMKGTGDFVTKTVDKTTETSLTPWGTNYRECTSNGVEAWQSKQAYGTWEFDLFTKNNINGSCRFQFMSMQDNAYPADAYLIDYGVDGKLRFARISSAGAFLSLFITKASFLFLNTWYGFKITRTTDGEFTVWIRGGSFGDVYTLVDTTGGGGSNPVTSTDHTTSSYSVMDLDVGDRYTNVFIRQGVVQ